MGHSPIDLHTHDMLVFFLNLVVGPELAPPVHVDFSLPVLYIFNLFSKIYENLLILEDSIYFITLSKLTKHIVYVVRTYKTYKST